jgi:hypothetical protein
MVDYVGRISVSIQEPGRIETVKALAIALADQKKIRKLKSVSLRRHIKCYPDRRILVDGHLIQADALFVESVNTFRYGKPRRELHRTMLAPANAFKGENSEIGFYFVEIAAVPISQFTFFVEKCDCPPFTLVVDQFRTLNRLGIFENSLKVGVSESAEDAPQLNEEFPVIPLNLGGRTERRQKAENQRNGTH